MVVLNINDQTETEAGNAGAVFDLSGAQARKNLLEFSCTSCNDRL